MASGNLRLRKVVVKGITVIECGVNDGGGNGAGRCGSETRVDTTKLTNVIMAGFG